MGDGDVFGVFLSYRRDEASGHAGRLYDTLAAALGPDRVFLDVHSIAPGRDFPDALMHALDRCSVVLTLIGPSWVHTTTSGGVRRLDDVDDVVRRELEIAFARGLRVIPVLLRGCAMPTEAELPESLRTLARCQAFELSDALWRETSSVLVDALLADAASGDVSLDPEREHTRIVDRVGPIVESLPQGVVTVLMTDIEGSTALWDRQPEQMSKALVRHEDVIAEVVQIHDGRLLRSRGEGDSTLSVFAKATDAVAAAVALQRRLQNEPWPGGLVLPTRVAVHTGEAELRNRDYYGGTLNRAARIRGVATGGQVLVSRAVHDLVVDVLAGDLELVAVGEHEFKGLQRSETVYAISGPGLNADAPATDDEVVIARPRTSFVGRADVVDRVERAVDKPGLVTLVGVGGIGKTRLALETAARVRDRFSHVHVVSLAAVSDPDAVRPEIANAVGVTGSADAMEGIALAVGRERSLLVIDNCEHLIDACAEVIDQLVTELPALTVLATSRVPLEVPGEDVVAVEPLPSSDAVRLLVDRGGRREPDPGTAEHDTLQEIGRRLDGIPLALELTGARLRSMSAADLLARLPVLDAAAKRAPNQRHVTMRAALDWSYELLTEQEGALLRRLSVFAGFTLDAAEHVTPGEDDDTLSDRAKISELLDQLVLHSLVVFDVTTGRYRLLEPVRQYASECVERAGEAATTRDRHAQYFARVSDRVARAMANGEQSRTELDDDEGNVEAALRWADECGDDELLCRIIGALGFFWYSTNASQGLRWTRRAVGRARHVPPALSAAVLLAAGELAQTQRAVSADPAASAWLDEAVATYRRLGRSHTLAWALFWRGRLLLRTAHSRAKESFDEALAKFRTHDDAFGTAWTLWCLREIAYEDGDDDLCASWFAELSEVAATRAPAVLGVVLDEQAFAALDRGDTASALGYIAAAEERQREGDRHNLLTVLLDRAWIECQVGSRERALKALCEAIDLGRRIGAVYEQHQVAIVAAALLIDTDAKTEAREVLHAADALEGSRLRRMDFRRSRGQASVIEARLDLNGPPSNQFDNFTDAIDWLLRWLSEQIVTADSGTEGRGIAPLAYDAASTGPVPMGSPPLTALVGRADVIARIEDTLARPGLVTLVGPGGIGKTRLLEEACAQLDDRFERVWRIDLVAARDRAALESAFEAAMLPVRDPMTQSADVGATPELTEEIAAHIAGRRVLVALDNCEQLLDFLPDVVEALLRRAPTLTVLATSREPLGSRGEIVVPVAPLELPADDRVYDASQLQHVESVELLVARARERGAELSVTAETADDIGSICRQLDGVPLALELAAARLPSTSVRALAARLARQLDVLSARRADQRHRSLRNAIDWSYELLEPVQQVLLRRLGVFVGGFTLDVAEEVCSGDSNDPLPQGDAVYLNLSELVAKSLVVFDRDQNRYRMLEPIRQFACALLDGSTDAVPVAERHVAWVLRRSREVLTAQFVGTGGESDDFAIELDNVHSALDWLYEHGKSGMFLQIVAVSGYVWSMTDWRRGRVAAERAVAMSPNASPRLRAAVLLSRGIVEQRADLAGSASWLREAWSLYSDLGDEFSLAWCTFFLGRAYEDIDLEEAERLMRDAVTLFERLQLGVGQAWALMVLGIILDAQGEYERGRDQLARALALARHTRQEDLIATGLAELGTNALQRGDAADARRCLREAVQHSERGHNDRWNAVGVFTQAACAEIATGAFDAAEPLLHRSLQFAIEIDDEWQLREALLTLALAKANQKQLDTARLLRSAALADLEELPSWISEHSMIAWMLRGLDHLLGTAWDEEERTSAASPLDVARQVLVAERQ